MSQPTDDKGQAEIENTGNKSELIETLGAEPLDKDAYIKKMLPLQADTLRFMVADLTEELRRLSVVLQDIAEMTNPDDPDCYRSDDREGCFDTVFYRASTALKRSP